MSRRELGVPTAMSTREPRVPTAMIGFPYPEVYPLKDPNLDESLHFAILWHHAVVVHEAYRSRIHSIGRLARVRCQCVASRDRLPGQLIDVHGRLVDDDPPYSPRRE